MSIELEKAIAMIEADLALPIDLVVELTSQGIDVETLEGGSYGDESI